MNIGKVLLIGGTGFVGAALASRLSGLGAQVLIPTRRRESHKALILLPRVTVVEARVSDPATLLALMQGVDVVVNLAGILHDRDSRRPYGKRFAAVHAELPVRIVQAMQQAGVRRLIQMSALKASAEAPSGYLRSKAAGEAAVLAASDLDVTIFRPSLIVGSNDAFLNKFAALLECLPIIPLAGATTRFQPVVIGDVVEAIVRSLNDQATFGHTYELAGPKSYSLRELVDYVARLRGRRRFIIGLPEALAMPLAQLLVWLPDPPMSPDNLRMMRANFIADGRHNFPRWSPQPLEAVAPAYLVDKSARSRHAARRHAGF